MTELEDKVTGICPREKVERTFKKTTEPLAPTQLYRCETCNILVSDIYLRNKTWQRAYEVRGKREV